MVILNKLLQTFQNSKCSQISTLNVGGNAGSEKGFMGNIMDQRVCISHYVGSIILVITPKHLFSIVEDLDLFVYFCSF